MGDCWYLAAVSALAEKPDRLKKIFKNKEYPEEGIFELTFKVKGIDTSIVIDDRLPRGTYSLWPKPAASKPSTDGAWWTPIIEKAFAKLNVNYININGG